MPKVSLTQIVSGYLRASAINADNTALEDAIDNTLSRDGTAPNAMNAQIDMGTNRIINLPTAVAGSEPITLDQAAALVSTDTVLTQAVLAAFLWPETAEEIAAAVTPANLVYPPGNLLRYGAVGDGTTDDWQAMEDAVASHPEKLYAPAGTYWMDASVHTEGTRFITNGVSIRGDGGAATIFKEAKFRCETGTPEIGWTIDGVGFTEYNSALYFNQSVLISITNCHFDGTGSTTAQAIQLFETSKALIDNNYFEENVTGVRLADDNDDPNQWITISNNIFDNNGITTMTAPAGVNITAGRHVTVTGNVFRRFRIGLAAAGGYGIYEGDGALMAGDGFTKRDENINITGNTFEDIENACIRFHFGHNITISSNTARNTEIANYPNTADFVLLDGDDDPVDTANPSPSNFNITGNNTWHMRFIIAGAADTSIETLSITNNIIEDSGNEGINIQDCNRTIVANNNIKNTDASGILVNDCDLTKVHDNLIIDANQDDEAAGNTEKNAGIRWTGAGVDGEIYNNTVDNVAANGAHYVVNFGGTVTRVIYHHNIGKVRTAVMLGHHTVKPAGAGTFETGDFIPKVPITFAGDDLFMGFVCSSGGSPGTWHDVFVKDAAH